MKKFIASLFVIVAMVTVFAVTTGSAGAAPAQAGKVGPYEGVFNGTLTADNGTKAPITLNLTHRGSVVDGTVFIGKGLNIDAGICGATAIPETAVNATGNTSAKNPKYLSASSSFDVSGIDVTVDLESVVQGDKLSTEAKIDLPWLCGGDPVLTGTLYKA